MTDEIEEKTQEETPKPKTKTKAKAPTKPKAKKYVAQRQRMWHPFQQVYISAEPKELELDSWLESQIEVGLIKEV
jgi:TATA-binding protein-associated factor Taf7